MCRIVHADPPGTLPPSPRWPSIQPTSGPLSPSQPSASRGDGGHPGPLRGQAEMTSRDLPGRPGLSRARATPPPREAACFGSWTSGPLPSMQPHLACSPQPAKALLRHARRGHGTPPGRPFSADFEVGAPADPRPDPGAGEPPSAAHSKPRHSCCEYCRLGRHSRSRCQMPIGARGGESAPAGAKRTPVGEHLGKSKQVSAMYLNVLAVSLGE